MYRLKSSNRSQDRESSEFEQTLTKRNTVKALEEILYKSFKVLDHGFIRVIDYMGDDSSIVQAARVSYGKGTKTIYQDQGLIRYLMRHRHTTPFEMCDIKFHVKLPIFVARQWIRHRTASVNEYSARYSILAKEFYLPEKKHLSVQSKTNKQGRESTAVPDSLAEKVLGILKKDANICYEHYKEMLNEDENGDIIDVGVACISRELARMNLTLNYYTEWYWKTNLHNLLHFLALRTDSHAQYEIRAYAKKILDIVKLWVPYSFEAFNDYVAHAVTISRNGLEVVKRMIAGKEVVRENSKLSKREWNELMTIIGNVGKIEKS